MRKMPFYTEIKDGILRWKAKKVFDAYCLMQKDGDYTLTLSKTVASKTNEQLGYFHAVVVPTAFNQIKEFEGRDLDGHKRFPQVSFMINDQLKQIPMTEDNVILMLKMVWAKHYNREVKSKADMNIEEASQLLSISIIWCERYLGCHIPLPDKGESQNEP